MIPLFRRFRDSRQCFVLLSVLALYPQSISTQGACTCVREGKYSLFLTYNWEDIPGTVISTEIFDVLAESTFSIGSCPYKDAVPPKKTCKANGGSSSVSKWALIGSISPALWGVSGERSASADYKADCASSAVISSWCTCCHMRSGLVFSTTTKQMRCKAAATDKSPVACANIISGSKKEFLNVKCDELGCAPPTPCSAVSPDPSGA
jgi:hypothetical protein